jgi:hypothetical protein
MLLYTGNARWVVVGKSVISRKIWITDELVKNPGSVFRKIVGKTAYVTVLNKEVHVISTLTVKLNNFAKLRQVLGPSKPSVWNWGHLTSNVIVTKSVHLLITAGMHLQRMYPSIKCNAYPYTVKIILHSSVGQVKTRKIQLLKTSNRTVFTAGQDWHFQTEQT